MFGTEPRGAEAPPFEASDLGVSGHASVTSDLGTDVLTRESEAARHQERPTGCAALGRPRLSGTGAQAVRVSNQIMKCHWVDCPWDRLSDQSCVGARNTARHSEVTQGGWGKSCRVVLTGCETWAVSLRGASFPHL